MKVLWNEKELKDLMLKIALDPDLTTEHSFDHLKRVEFVINETIEGIKNVQFDSFEEYEEYPFKKYFDHLPISEIIDEIVEHAEPYKYETITWEDLIDYAQDYAHEEYDDPKIFLKKVEEELMRLNLGAFVFNW